MAVILSNFQRYDSLSTKSTTGHPQALTSKIEMGNFALGEGHPMKRQIMCRVVAAAVVVSAMGLLASPAAWATSGIHNFGGYSAAVTASASADITVPATSSLSCSSAQGVTVDLWVALTRGEYASNAGLNVQCIHGTPILFVSGAAGTLSFRFPVSGGDVISISVTESGAATTVTADDTTSTVSDSANFVGATTPLPSIVQFGAVSTSKAIPHFGPVTYSSVTADGTVLDSSVATSRRLTRSHPPGVGPGPLVSGSFTLTET